jgi:hypothetical protein
MNTGIPSFGHIVYILIGSYITYPKVLVWKIPILIKSTTLSCTQLFIHIYRLNEMESELTISQSHRFVTTVPGELYIYIYIYIYKT